MTTYVGCPGCGVKYPLKQLYHHAHDRPSQSRVYTVVCAVCGQQFDVGFQRRWRGLLPLRPSVRPITRAEAVGPSSASFPGSAQSSPGR
jgi:hypothetical protein